MKIGMVGLGRMGGNMVRRLLRVKHQCVVFDSEPNAVSLLVKEGAVGAFSREQLVQLLNPPRIIWFMIPASHVEQELYLFAQLLKPCDILIDGGNSHFKEDQRRAKYLKTMALRHVDVGTSGGILGLTRGYCLMIGGDFDTFQYLEPIFEALAPGIDSVPPTVVRNKTKETADKGYLHCGPSGAGHFVKMIHNAIEYGIMASYAEGFNILHHANPISRKDVTEIKLSSQERIEYNFDLKEIAELWRHGSIISSWLLDLTAELFAKDTTLQDFADQIPDTGSGKWAIQTAITESVPANVLSAALFERFCSRKNSSFSNRIISALRYSFGGHLK